MDRRELADLVEVRLLSRSMGRTASDVACGLLGGTSPRLLSRAEDALGVVSQRAEVLGAAYPLCDGSGVWVPRTDDMTWYSALLAASRSTAPTLVDAANELLDEVVTRALPGLLGPGTRVVNFAWPVRPGQDPRPEAFPEAVRWLGERLGLAVGHGYRPPRKDGGVDLVALRPLAGSPLSGPAALVQTTLSTDVRTKSRDIDLDVWRTWLDLSPSTWRVLAVPFECSHDAHVEAHASGVLLLDRLRLVQLLDGVPWLALPEHVRRWAQWRWSAICAEAAQ